MDNFDEEIEKLKTELNEVRLKLSELRKKGMDTKIIELKFMNYPNKIKLQRQPGSTRMFTGHGLFWKRLRKK